MKVCLASHSLIHPRQYFFATELRRQGIEVLEIYPKQWRNLRRGGGFEVHSEESIYTYVFGERAIREIEGFDCDWLYCMMEPDSLLAYQMSSLARRLRCRFACFTWENIEKTYAFPFQREVLNSCNLIICGNPSARRIMINKGVEPSRLVLIPQAGVNIDLFRPNSHIQKDIDVLYVGRMAPEKGVAYIKEAYPDARFVSDVPYTELPKIYQHSRVFVTFPYDTPSWKEQFSYAIAEALSSGLPVVCSNAGSIPEIYGNADDVLMVKQRNLKLLKQAIMMTLEKVRQIEFPVFLDGRIWVEENLSNQVVAHKLLEAFDRFE